MPSVEIKLQEFHAGQKSIYRALDRRNVIRCGRRFGKTTLMETCACNWATNSQYIGWFSPTYKLLLPTYKRVLDTLRPIVKSASKIDMIIELVTGGQVEFWTLSDEDAGRSRKYHWALIDEGSLVKRGLEDTWRQAIEPTLLDFNGRAIMAGTPKGKDPENFFYTACEDKSKGWKEFHAPTAANPYMTPEALEAIKNGNPPLVWSQEYLAEFVDWSGDSFFALPALLVNDAPVPYPSRVDTIFVTIDSAIKTGKENDGTAVTYWGYQRFPDQKLWVLDWDIVQIEGASLEVWLPTVFERMQELAKSLTPLYGVGDAYIEDKASGSILLQQGYKRGWTVRAIDSPLTSVGKDERAISVSGYVHNRKVFLTEYAYNKTTTYKGVSRNHFLTQVFSFKIGVKDQADDLLDTFCYGISLALGDGDGF